MLEQGERASAHLPPPTCASSHVRLEGYTRESRANEAREARVTPEVPG